MFIKRELKKKDPLSCHVPRNDIKAFKRLNTEGVFLQSEIITTHSGKTKSIPELFVRLPKKPMALLPNCPSFRNMGSTNGLY